MRRPMRTAQRERPASCGAAGSRVQSHALRATFLSDTQSSVRARVDAYLCAFQLLELESGRLVWEDAFEVKYAVERNAFD